MTLRRRRPRSAPTGARESGVLRCELREAAAAAARPSPPPAPATPPPELSSGVRFALGWPADEGAPRLMIASVEWTQYRSAKGEIRSLGVLRGLDEDSGEALQPVRHLGAGSQGDVLLYETAGGARYALKTLSADWTEDDVEGARLWATLAIERPTLASLLVPVSVVRLRADSACLCMPVADGSLESFAPMSAAGAFFVAAAVADGLAALLEGGFAYTDVKAENVLVLRRGALAFLAFGDHGGLVRAGASGVSTYPPPERAAGNDVPADARCARWTVGALAVTMHFGHDPRLAYGERRGAHIRAGAQAAVERAGGRASAAGAALHLCFFGPADATPRDAARALRRAACALSQTV